MSFLQILNCDPDLVTVLGIVKLIINLICWAVPILLIILLTVDVAKIVTAGNLDDKMKKEVGNKIISRLIYAIVIFLIPTIIGLLFNLLGNNNLGSSDINGCTWKDAWQAAGKK